MFTEKQIERRIFSAVVVICPIWVYNWKAGRKKKKSDPLPKMVQIKINDVFGYSRAGGTCSCSAALHTKYTFHTYWKWGIFAPVNGKSFHVEQGRMWRERHHTTKNTVKTCSLNETKRSYFRWLPKPILHLRAANLFLSIWIYSESEEEYECMCDCVWPEKMAFTQEDVRSPSALSAITMSKWYELRCQRNGTKASTLAWRFSILPHLVWAKCNCMIRRSNATDIIIML